MSNRPEYEPTSNYTLVDTQGWPVYMHHCLSEAQAELGQRVLDVVNSKLLDVIRTLPESVLSPLRQVKIWLEAASEQVVCACYHPSRQWLTEHGFNPEKARSIEIGNATNFLAWTLHQPAMVLHELAHAYHHQVLGYDQPDIKEAYERAVESKSYESVLRYDGKYGRAYALNNDQEYFAELTECYFGTNDFYPFVRAELMQHDPQMYETLKKLWQSG